MDIQRAKTHPGVAAVLSFVFSGVGQLYNGEIKKGMLHISLTTLGLVMVLMGALVLGVYLHFGNLTLKTAVASVLLIVAGGAIICIVGVHSIYDAYKNAVQ